MKESESNVTRSDICIEIGFVLFECYFEILNQVLFVLFFKKSSVQTRLYRIKKYLFSWNFHGKKYYTFE